MAGLPRQAVSINLAGGIDTKSDKKHVIPGSLVKLENGVYRKNRSITKSSGYDEVENKNVSDVTLGSPSGLEVFNDELIQYNNQSVYSYSEGIGKWVDKGEAVSAIIKSKQIVKNTASQTQTDCAIVNGIGLYAWEDSRGGVRASVIDEETGAALLSDVSIDASASRVKCVAFGNHLFLYYYKSGSLYVQRLNPLRPTNFDGAVEVNDNVNTTNPNYDVYPYQDIRMLTIANAEAVAEVTSITAVADVSDSLDGKTFILYDQSGSVAFWIDVDDSGTTIPAEASAADRAVEITTIVTDDDAATVGGKLRTAVGADAQFSTSGSGAECIATDANTGYRSDGEASTSGFTLSTTTQGVGNGIRLVWLDETPTVQTGALAASYIQEAGSGCVTIVEGPSQTFYIGFHDGSDVKCGIYNNGGVQLYAPFSLETIGSIRNITGYKVNDDDGVQFLYEVDAAQDYNHYIKECKANDDGSAGTASEFARSVGLYSKAFSYTDSAGNRNSYVGVAHGSTLQSTYFVIRDDGLIVGKQQYTNGGGITTRTLLATVNAYTSENFVWAILKKIRIVSENATIFTPLGVMRTSMDFSSGDIFTAKQLGNNLLIVGGVLSMYDGESVVEHGFHLYPENGTATPATSGGSLADGSYQVYLVYEWTDNYGQIHRSEPSVAITATVSGGGGSGKITVVSPSLRLTRKDGTNRSNVSIVGYVTELNGSTAYRFTSVSSPTYNDVTADTVSLGEITDVSSITSNEILYTTGDILPNYPAPACSVIEVFKNRVFLGGLEEDNLIRFSKENKAEAPVEFAFDFRKSIESARGDVKAFGVIDDKICIFKGDRYYNTYGDGPNDTDTLGGFAEIEAVTGDMGAQDPRSVAPLPQGIILKSKKGYYSVDAALNPFYIGAPAEDYNSLSVTSANLLSDLNEVRFTTSDGDMLIYNYYFNKWSTATGLKAKDAVLWRDSYVLLKTDGKILKQNTSKWKNDLDSYKMSLESGWMTFGNIASFKRVYELMIFGDFKSTHKLRVYVGYDYSSAWEHFAVYDPVTNFPMEVYGQDSPYGETDTRYGGKTDAYMVRVKMKKQKCSAFRFRIEELVTTATEGTQESLTISDIGVLIGGKQGQNKVGANRTMGPK